MTSHYLDIAILPNPEIATPHILGALYDRLHRTLVQLRADGIGSSFPAYKLQPRQLGDTLRLHATEVGLQELQAQNWLHPLRDHVRASGIKPAPTDAAHRTVHRKQFKTNVERLRRRRMKRKGETAEEAARAIPDTAMKHPDLPYVHVRSLSTGQSFCIFIAMGALQVKPVGGRFNSYGLAEQGSTVPWF